MSQSKFPSLYMRHWCASGNGSGSVLVLVLHGWIQDRADSQLTFLGGGGECAPLFSPTEAGSGPVFLLSHRSCRLGWYSTVVLSLGKMSSGIPPSWHYTSPA